jgi:hypothetical protein
MHRIAQYSRKTHAQQLADDDAAAAARHGGLSWAACPGRYELTDVIT